MDRDTLKMLLDAKEIFVLQAKMCVQAASVPGKNTITNKHNGLYKLMFGGSAFTDAEKLSPDQWEMMDCDIIIVPKSMHRGSKNMGGHTLSQMLTSGFNNEENWKEKETF